LRVVALKEPCAVQKEEKSLQSMNQGVLVRHEPLCLSPDAMIVACAVKNQDEVWHERSASDSKQSGVQGQGSARQRVQLAALSTAVPLLAGLRLSRNPLLVLCRCRFHFFALCDPKRSLSIAVHLSTRHSSFATLTLSKIASLPRPPERYLNGHLAGRPAQCPHHGTYSATWSSDYNILIRTLDESMTASKLKHGGSASNRPTAAL
jgi:hypothetical protein